MFIRRNMFNCSVIFLSLLSFYTLLFKSVTAQMVQHTQLHFNQFNLKCNFVWKVSVPSYLFIHNATEKWFSNSEANGSFTFIAQTLQSSAFALFVKVHFSGLIKRGFNAGKVCLRRRGLYRCWGRMNCGRWKEIVNISTKSEIQN